MRGTRFLDQPSGDNSRIIPRMRGTPVILMTGWRRIRIIPAHAGNSRQRAAVDGWMADHPRACGELNVYGVYSTVADGSSPRMRGTRDCHYRALTVSRIIPAHAGNSMCRITTIQCSSDHPRACGELSSKLTFMPSKAGSSRACGELSGFMSLAICAAGSSPRMRGTQAKRDNPSAALRIIPAHAGNSSTCTLVLLLGSDHPRACGELVAANPEA